MRIRAGYDIVYECAVPTPLIMLGSLRPERLADLVTPARMSIRPAAPLDEYRDGFGNLCHRLVAPAGEIGFSTDFVVEDSGLPDAYVPEAVEHPVEDLPPEVLVYLLGSRYCETDLLGDLAWSLFAGAARGWGRVSAIVDYAHQQIAFDYLQARATRTASEANAERVGVCRDYAHLAIALCRCMNIPARYCTGYLGDIGVPPVDAPMDFSAWFEAYLGGAWRTFDARHNRPRVGRIKMAHGRDATDVAITTAFGNLKVVSFDVVTEQVD